MASENTPIGPPPANSPASSDMDRVLAELREANERLIVAGVRLQELAEQASAAQAQAEAANRAKDEFLAALSHELRTPLNAILGWTHMLRHRHRVGVRAVHVRSLPAGRRYAHRAYGGLGLGLAIVRQLMEPHGGTVRGESGGPGQGSAFTLTFPIPALTIGPNQIAPATSSPSLRNLRVLVVEDEPDSRELLTALLGANGAIVTAVQSVPEALAQLDAVAPQVLISDIGLPHEDGYSLIRQFRARDAGSAERVPAMALTAYARPEDREKAIAAGFQMHVAKPVAPVEFMEAVAALARKAKVRS